MQESSAHTAPAQRSRQPPDAARLRQQYVAALSQFIGRLALSGEAMRRVRDCLKQNHSSPVEALLDQIAVELDEREQRADPGAPAGSADIDAVLLTLFDRLTLAPAVESAARAQKQRLLDGIAAEELPRFVNGLAELISRNLLTTQKEKKELEEFIEHILAELRQMESFVRNAEDDLRSSQDNQQALQEVFDDQVQCMERDVAGAADLDALKRDVSARLRSIRANMSSFRDKESLRMRRTEQRNEQLSAQLGNLEQETAALRQQLQEGRAQLLKDTLTGVHSRFAFEERVELEFVRWKRFAAPLSFLLWDIDFFKSINDSFGHKAGDRVLRLVAQLIVERVRESDFFARVGGEEFAMLLPGTAAADALRTADEIRNLVQQSGFNHKGQPVDLTVSCGVTEYRPGDTPELVFERADRALYKAKQAGRNRCVTS